MFWNRKKKEKEERIKNKVAEFKKQIIEDLNQKYKFGDKLDDGNIFITTNAFSNMCHIVFNPNKNTIEYIGFNESYLKELAVKEIEQSK